MWPEIQMANVTVISILHSFHLGLSKYLLIIWHALDCQILKNDLFMIFLHFCLIRSACQRNPCTLPQQQSQQQKPDQIPEEL